MAAHVWIGHYTPKHGHNCVCVCLCVCQGRYGQPTPSSHELQLGEGVISMWSPVVFLVGEESPGAFIFLLKPPNVYSNPNSEELLSLRFVIRISDVKVKLYNSDWDLNPQSFNWDYISSQELMKLGFLIFYHGKNSVRDKVIGKKWIYLERNTPQTQCGPSQEVRTARRSFFKPRFVEPWFMTVTHSLTSISLNFLIC